MNKERKKKWILPLVGGVIAVLVIAVVVVLTQRDEAYRVVKVENYEGSVALERDATEEEIFEGMNLKSQDTITTGDESLVELLADSDKHILAQENTCFSIEATGNEEEGKITINLEYGISLYELESKLPDGSEFEVQTPNAALSVRGTTFGVSYDTSKDETTVVVMEGVVEVTTATETKELVAGDVVTITGDTGVIVEENVSDAEDTSESNEEVSNTEDKNNSVINEILADGISEEEFPEVLKGNTNLVQLQFVLETMQYCMIKDDDNYLDYALNRIYLGQTDNDAYTPIAETSAGCTFDITALNNMFSVMTDEEISADNIPSMCTINGNELSYPVCDITGSGGISVTIENYYVDENNEILVEYSYRMTYGSDGMSGVKGESIAHLLPDEGGRYVISSIEETVCEEFNYN